MEKLGKSFERKGFKPAEQKPIEEKYQQHTQGKYVRDLSREEIIKLTKNDDRDFILFGADDLTEYGYVKLPNIVLQSTLLSANAKLVYAVVASYAFGKKTQSYPSQETMANECGLGKRTIIRGLKELDELGYIIIVRRGLNKTNKYIFPLKFSGNLIPSTLLHNPDDKLANPEVPN